MAAGYCPDKIRTKALAICRENNIRIVPVGTDELEPDVVIVVPKPVVPKPVVPKPVQISPLAKFLNKYRTVNELIVLSGIPNLKVRSLLDAMRRRKQLSIMGKKPNMKYRLSTGRP